MTETAVPRLCGNCAHLSVCKFTENGAGGRSVLCCEEFMVELFPARTRARPKPRKVPSVAPGAVEMGLCMDCGNRDRCSLRTRSEGGVWHCEEYE